MLGRRASLAIAWLGACSVLAGCPSLAGFSSRAPADAGGDVEDAGDEGVDSGDDASCVTVAVTPPVPAHGGASCPPAGDDGGAGCYPLDESSYSWQWRPPRHVPGACTSTQIDDFYTDCLDQGFTMAQCSSWQGDVANAKCRACLYSLQSSGTYGAIVLTQNAVHVNAGGCLALVEPCNQPCAAALMAKAFCELDACRGCSGNAAIACTDQAPICSSCGGYEAPSECSNIIQAAAAQHPAVTLCGLDQPNFQQQYTKVATFMCGPGP